MRIIFNELKKIFNIKSLMVLGVISFIIYKMFLDFHIEVFPNGRPPVDIYEISKRVVDEKGINLPENSSGYFKELEEEYKEDASKYVRESKEAEDLGIKTYDELYEARNNIKDPEGSEIDKRINNLYNDIIFNKSVDSFWKVQGISYFVDSYKYKDTINEGVFNSQDELERNKEIISSKSYNDMLPSIVIENFNQFIFNSAKLVVVSVIFMLSPLFTGDKHKKLEYIQYTTKRGRRLYKDKVKTSLIAGFIIATVELSVLFALYLTRSNTVERFYGANINSWFAHSPKWFDLTFGQYIIVAVVIVYLLTLVVALLTSYISRKSTRYITLVGVCILTTIGLSKLVTLDIIMWNGIGSLYRPKFMILGFILGGMALCIVLLGLRYRKEKIMNIL